MSNRLSDLRTNVAAALQALPALSGITVEKIAIPVDIWAIPAGRAIGVCRLATRWTPEGPEISKFDDQPTEGRFAIVIKTDSPASNIEGLDGEGQAEDLVAAVLGIRGVNVGTVDTGPVFLYADDEQTLAHPDRARGGAGPIATVVHFTTTEFAY